MGANYKLIYYDFPGRAEPIRLIFALANVSFEEQGIKREDWPKWKPLMPWGQIPVLEVDGKPIAQSITIGRFLARRFNLIGSNEFDQVKAEELVDSTNDFISEIKKYRMEQDTTKKQELMKNLVEKIVPTYYKRLDNILLKKSASSHFFVGNSVTWADAWIYNVIDRVNQNIEGGCELLNSYPNLKRMRDSFENIPEITNYLKK